MYINMKRSIVFLTMLVFGSMFAACESEVDAPPSDDITPLKFDAKAGFLSRYDWYEVDTANAAGNNPDRLATETKVTIEETTVDTGLTYAGRTGVSMHVPVPDTGKIDTIYFAQDANGDLYRYNYGFTLLNNFPALSFYLEKPIDMGWVLVMKFGKKEGATWRAKKDSLYILSLNTTIHFESNATMMSDTIIKVGNENIECRQAEHVITATANFAGFPINGKIVTRTYISAKYGKVVWDFIRSGRITGISQVRGVYKIMTFHE
jgi:hypothetical protein